MNIFSYPIGPPWLNCHWLSFPYSSTPLACMSLFLVLIQLCNYSPLVGFSPFTHPFKMLAFLQILFMTQSMNTGSYCRAVLNISHIAICNLYLNTYRNLKFTISKTELILPIPPACLILIGDTTIQLTTHPRNLLSVLLILPTIDQLSGPADLMLTILGTHYLLFVPIATALQYLP